MHHEAQMKTYNLGIIGAGMYGQVLMRYFQQEKCRRLVCDRSRLDGGA